MNSDWLGADGDIDWSHARTAHHQARRLARRIGTDRGLLSSLVFGLEDDPDRFGRCEVHPLMHRLILHEDTDRQFQIRLHVVSDSARDIVPHDHKYTFTVYILAGGYLHVWNRRHAGRTGDFSSADITPGVVAIEQRGACYTLGNSLVHQTIMTPGTVSIFIRGPKMQSRWHAATDMADFIEDGYEVPKEGAAHLGGVQLEVPEYLKIRQRLVARGLIDDLRSVHAAV